MSKTRSQQYANHRRFSPFHHFIFAPLGLIAFIGAIKFLFSDRAVSVDSSVKLLFLILSFTVILVGFIARSYATGLQDRVIRTEEQFRHYRLTGQLLDSRLTMGQIIALRFASDEEFPGLAKQAAESAMKPDQIKRAVRQWRADHNRV